MHGEELGYGFWSLVALNAAIFVLFALSFLTPVKRREWRPFGLYTRLARREEREAEVRFGEAYRQYRARVPMFVPRIGGLAEPSAAESPAS